MGGRGSRFGGFQFFNITGPKATGHIIDSGAGIFGGIVFNGGTLGSGAVYNNTYGSGEMIAQLGIPAANYDGADYNVRYNTGLTLVLASASNVTVTYFPED